MTRQNNRLLATGRAGLEWRPLDLTRHARRWIMAYARGRAWRCRLAGRYVRDHVELAYATTADRVQGRTVNTAHAMVSPTTTREVLYVSATRGREANTFYVDTYNADPQTSHNDAGEPMTAKELLLGVLRNEGGDVAAHEVIRHQLHEAEDMERLAAEYVTLAALARASWLGHVGCQVRVERE